MSAGLTPGVTPTRAVLAGKNGFLVQGREPPGSCDSDSLAPDFYPIDAALAARPRIKRLFRRLTLLWGLAIVAKGTTALWLLLSQSTLDLSFGPHRARALENASREPVPTVSGVLARRSVRVGTLRLADDHGCGDEPPGDHEGDLGVGTGVDDTEATRGIGADVSYFATDKIFHPVRDTPPLAPSVAVQHQERHGQPPARDDGAVG
jgi:hypothetical protein